MALYTIGDRIHSSEMNDMEVGVLPNNCSIITATDHDLIVNNYGSGYKEHYVLENNYIRYDRCIEPIR